MKNTKVRQIKRATILTAESVERLLSVFPAASKYLYQIQCDDGSSLETDQLSEVQRYPNAQSRAIEEIRVRTDYGFKPSVNVLFSKEILGPAWYSIEGEDAEVTHIASQVEQQLETMQLGYPALSDSYIPALASGALAGVGFSMMVFAFAYIVKRNHIWIYLAFTALILFILSALLVQLVKYFLPSIVFSIGNGETRFLKMQARRKLIGNGIILTLILGVISSLAAAHIYH